MDFNPNIKENNEISQVEYNLSNTKIIHIGNLIINADNHFLNGNLTRAFHNWTRVCRHIRSRFSKKEYLYSQNLEFEFERNKNELDKAKRRSRFSYLYDKYEFFLQKMLKKYGFDMKERQTEEYLV